MNVRHGKTVPSMLKHLPYPTLHGRFDLFAAILKTGEVINDKYEWIYGSNHLVIDGDIFDRGADVLPILWLIYKLEFEAKAVGGRVTTILGITKK